MNKLFLILISLLAITSFSFGFNVTIIESESFNSGQRMDSIWYSVCVSMGYTASVLPQTTLDDNTFFATTDLLIVSSGVIALPNNRILTIQQFLQTGKPAYIQAEYLPTYGGDIAFQTIVNNLGGTFAWGGTTDGDLAPMNILGTFATNNNAVTSLSYYWYGCYGTGGCTVENMIEYNGQYFGFQFCPPTTGIGRLSTTSDQDWVNSQTSNLFMENILTNLITPGLCTSNGAGPTVNLGPDTSLCPGDSLVLNATNPNCTYLWSNSTTDSTLTVNSTGTYSVTVTNASGCTGTDSINVSFNGITPTITGALSFCTGSYTTLSVDSGYVSYIWSTFATVDTIHVTSSGTYSVTVSSSGGCTGTASVSVTESANLTPTISGNTLLCTGGASILDAGNGYATYQWSTSATTETITVTMIGPYYVTVTNNVGCAGTDSVFVTQLSPIYPTLTGATSLCIGDSSTLKAGQGFVTYLWSNSATTDTLVVTTSGTYFVTVTDANGCTGSDSITVTFYPTAVTSFTADTLNGCAPFTVLFNNTTTNANNYLWNFGDGDTSTLANPSHIYSTSGTYTVTLIGYGGGGCNDTLIRTTYIHVITPPDLTDSFSVSPATGCVGDLISFTNNSTNATSYLWNFGDGNTSTATNPTHIYSLLGSYNVTLYSINNTVCGLMIDSSKTQVIIYPNAIASFDSPDTGGCPPYTVTFVNGSTLAASYSWNFGDGGTSTALNPTYTYTNPGFYTVTLIAFGQNGCNDTLILSDYIDVHNPGIITAQFHADTLTGCNPFTVDFINTSINGSTYWWSFGDFTNDTSQNPIHTYVDSGSYTITLIVNNIANGCVSAPDTLKITDYINVIDPPVVKSNFSGSPLIGCNPLTVNFNNTSTNATYYYWSFGDGALDTAKNPTHTYADSGIYTVFLIVGDTGSVCRTTYDTITFKDYVTVEWCELFIPNVFSPNGDAMNDFFKIIAEGYTNYHVTIFNRWGEKVFDNSNAETLWNGKINGNGSDASDGTYYYILNVTDPNGKPITMKGSLMLIR